MAPRTRAERAAFFADLEKLDQLSGDESEKKPPRAANIPLPISAQSTIVAEEQSRKRKPSSPASQPRPLPQPAQSSTSILRPSTSDPTTVIPRPASPPSESTPATLRPSTSDSTARPPKTVSPPTLRRTQSEKIAPVPKGKKAKNKPETNIPLEDRVFQGLVFFFIPNKDDDPVRRIRINLAIQHGASWARSWTDPVTHVIIDKDLPIDRAAREFRDKKLPDGIPIVKDEWLVECLKYRSLRDLNGVRFRVLGMNSPFAIGPAEGTSSRPVSTIENSDYRSQAQATDPNVQVDTGAGKTPEHRQPQLIKDNGARDELDEVISELQQLKDIPEALLEDNASFSADSSTSSFTSFEEKDDTAASNAMTGFVCMEKNDGSNNNPNARTIDILQKLAQYNEEVHDQWRARAFKKAASALRRQPTLIRTREEALKIRDIGKSGADAIHEFMTSDRLRRLDGVKANPTDRVLSLFTGVYGAGLQQAHFWFAQGYRTLDDLREKAKLTSNQKVGLEHYDDFLQRVPRAEVEQHAAIVESALRSVDKELELIIGGSYRRGSPDCGDIDLLIMKRDAGKEHLHTLMTHTVMPLLTKQRFLKVGLSTSNSRDDGSKWHGASCLPDSSVWRRMDLLYVPWEERGAALIYFTGNDFFNRSLRLLAGRKAMRLNQHGLFKGVLRGPKREKLNEGELVESRSEKKIFEILGVKWRPPEHRIC